MVINKKAEAEVIFVGMVFVEVLSVEVLFVGTVFVEVLFAVSIISSHMITESPIICPDNLPFSQLHFAGFQK